MNNVTWQTSGKTALLLVALSVSPIAYPVIAQPNPDKPSIRQEVRTYARENIAPVMRAQRQQLETVLSQEEKQQIALLRESLKHLNRQSRAVRTSMEDHPTDQQRAALQTLREEKRALLTQAKAIADQHQEVIEGLLATLTDEQTQWKAEIRALVSQHAATAVGGDRLRGRKFRKAWRTYKPAFFVLLQPASPAEARGTSSLLYPNPVRDASVLEYQLDKKGPVTIVIFDLEGLPVKTLVHAIQDKGKYTLQLNEYDLPSGTYTYTISTASGTHANRFVKL